MNGWVFGEFLQLLGNFCLGNFVERGLDLELLCPFYFKLNIGFYGQILGIAIDDGELGVNVLALNKTSNLFGLTFSYVAGELGSV